MVGELDMALNNDFYEKIFEKEKYYTYLSEKKLLNIYYLKGKDSLKEFYETKLEELKLEMSIGTNNMLQNVYNIILELVSNIDLLISKSDQGESIDVNSIIPFFLYNKMTNNNIINKDETELKLIRLQVKKQILKENNELYNYNPEDDALLEIDDFGKQR